MGIRMSPEAGIDATILNTHGSSIIIVNLILNRDPATRVITTYYPDSQQVLKTVDRITEVSEIIWMLPWQSTPFRPGST